MFKLCGTFLLSAISCLGLQRVSVTSVEVAPDSITQPAPVEIQYFEHTEKVVWMQINDHAYSEIALNKATIALLEKSSKIPAQ